MVAHPCAGDRLCRRTPDRRRTVASILLNFTILQDRPEISVFSASELTNSKYHIVTGARKKVIHLASR
ncbi:hypothetical protein [Nitratireductor sp. GCM10026969]|uniref:hypothetical protein n=1 Tax=Nitratireductor sp. GCM10026969 TaxID=3252645 RepID=UPI00360DB10B